MTRRYDHTQPGRFHAFFGVLALGLLIASPLVASPERWALLGAAGLFALLAAAFARLRVWDAGDRLRLRFGPLPLLGWSFPYDAISDVAVGRSSLLDGWGVHYVPLRGWTFNLWGRDCVEFRLRGARRRIGTDDPRGLLAFLRERAGAGERGPAAGGAYSATRGGS